MITLRVSLEKITRSSWMGFLHGGVSTLILPASLLTKGCLATSLSFKAHFHFNVFSNLIHASRNVWSSMAALLRICLRFNLVARIITGHGTSFGVGCRHGVRDEGVMTPTETLRFSDLVDRVMTQAKNALSFKWSAPTRNWVGSGTSSHVHSPRASPRFKCSACGVFLDGLCVSPPCTDCCVVAH